MKRANRLRAGAVALMIGSGLAAAPVAANASEEGRRNTAIALGAAAAYLLVKQKDKVPGLIAGAGAAYAYKKYNDAKTDRQKRERLGYYGDRNTNYDRNNYDRNNYDYRNDRDNNLRHDRDGDRQYRRTDRERGTYNDRYDYRTNEDHCDDRDLRRDDRYRNDTLYYRARR